MTKLWPSPFGSPQKPPSQGSSATLSLHQRTAEQVFFWGVGGGGRVESIFNISFWAKEQAIGWERLGLPLAKERQTDELLVAKKFLSNPSKGSI